VIDRKVPLHYEKIRREDIQPIFDKVIHRIPVWKRMLLSSKARPMLLKACLASIPIYLMYVIKFPKWAIEAINSQMANIFGMIRKEKGGLGILELRDFILCHLVSWIQGY
jgi:hypothetical protein